jgi:hypothetical protein
MSEKAVYFNERPVCHSEEAPGRRRISRHRWAKRIMGNPRFFASLRMTAARGGPRAPESELMR